jgi:hypothetical protein
MKIIVPVCNNARFIEMQVATFRKFIKDDYEFIVFNDAKRFPDFSNYGDVTIYGQIAETCKRLGLQCIAVPNEEDSHNAGASGRHARTMNFVFSYMKTHPDQYWIFDSDMFMIHDFNLHQYDGVDCAVVLQERPGLRYVWPNIFYFNTMRLRWPELVNFNTQAPGDSGGAMCRWLSKYEKESPSSFVFIPYLQSERWNTDTHPVPHIAENVIQFIHTDPRNRNRKYWCEIYNNSILHYRAGSNWRREGREFHDRLTDALYKILMDQ